VPTSIWLIWAIAPVGAVVALVFAWIFFQQMKRADEGDPDMIRVSGYVREGALAYLKRQYMVVAIVFVLISAVL
jgi:K(+)-stimulated pyrophosphate-energized sodium pump